jgi:hypothetical protein
LGGNVLPFPRQEARDIQTDFSDTDDDDIHGLEDNSD